MKSDFNLLMYKEKRLNIRFHNTSPYFPQENKLKQLSIWLKIHIKVLRDKFDPDLKVCIRLLSD